jgi:pimeloyl-ACP methyl ester carboxylesterase
VEDLYQLLKALDIEKAVIGGLSMGGYESLRFYLTHPEMVKALVLMDTGPGYRNPDRMAEWNRGREERAKRLETEGIEFLAANAPTETRRDIMLKQNPIGLAHMARTVVAQHDSRVIDSLSEISVPTLVLVGENDRPFLAAGQVMAKKIPSSVHVVIPDAGHAANIDNTEVFNREVLGFLSQLDL